MKTTPSIESLFGEAVALARRGDNEAAKAACLKVLSLDPGHFGALNDLAGLLHAEGRVSAARLAYAQAVALHPANPVARVNLGNLLYEDGDHAAAEIQYRAALDAAPDFPQAHQGLARILSERGEEAARHWRKGFDGHAVVVNPYRGTGEAISVLLLITAKFGNVETKRWLHARDFAITQIHAAFFNPEGELPRHALLVNAIGDADLCREDLEKAHALAARSSAPVINAPQRVQSTGRIANDARFARIANVRTAHARLRARQALLSDEALAFPALIPRRVSIPASISAMSPAAKPWRKNWAGLPGDEVFVLDPLDARGPDGLFRKFRAMFVGGEIFPCIWRYPDIGWCIIFSDMAEHAGFREEERRFLEAMPEVLGPKAMQALRAIERELGLDYGGVDFGLAPDGALLLFEANATMNVFPPEADAKWDYRRTAVQRILSAARDMAKARAASG